MTSYKSVHSPSTDGVDHINVYSKGSTMLGRFLTNMFTDSIGVVTEDGFVTSVECLWHYLKTGDPKFKTMSGFEAKNTSKKLKRNVGPMSEYNKQKIKTACRNKLMTNPQMLYEFATSTLPLAHYYVYNDVPYYPGNTWLMAFWEDLRKELKMRRLSPSKGTYAVILDEGAPDLVVELVNKIIKKLNKLMFIYRLAEPVVGVPETINAHLITQEQVSQELTYTDMAIMRSIGDANFKKECTVFSDKMLLTKLVYGNQHDSPIKYFIHWNKNYPYTNGGLTDRRIAEELVNSVNLHFDEPVYNINLSDPSIFETWNLWAER